jgi:protein-S-isoprenylcysteine O-methyltransferase Ste14
MILLKVLVGILFQILFFGALLILPSQGANWFEAYFFLAYYACITIPYGIFSAIYYPKGMEARMVVSSPQQSVKDKIIMAAIVLIFILGILLIPIDLFYLSIIEKASFTFQLLGLIIFTAGFLIIGKAQNQNDFIEPVVEIQKDRGHVVIDSGLYEYVRHPMYTGFILFFAGMALWHGSIFVTLLVSVSLFLALAYRIRSEEEVLEKDLEGYLEYKKKVKSKIFPKLF